MVLVYSTKSKCSHNFSLSLNVNVLSVGNHEIRLKSLVAEMEIAVIHLKKLMQRLLLDLQMLEAKTKMESSSKKGKNRTRLSPLSNRPAQSFHPSKRIRRRISCNLLGSGHTLESVRICAGEARTGETHSG